MGSSPLRNEDMSFFRSFGDSFINNSSPVIVSLGPILGLLMVSLHLAFCPVPLSLFAASPALVLLVFSAVCLDSRSAIPATSPLFPLMV